MTRDKTRYKYGDYILRERKGRYYVYKLEYENGKARETYVGPLTDVVETYIKIRGAGIRPAGGMGDLPTMRPPGFEPGISGLGGQRPNPGWTTAAQNIASCDRIPGYIPPK